MIDRPLIVALRVVTFFCVLKIKVLEVTKDPRANRHLLTLSHRGLVVNHVGQSSPYLNPRFIFII